MADTNPPKKRTAPTLKPQTEPSQNEPIPTQTGSTHGASPSTKSFQLRSRHKRMRLESPTPQPRQDPLSSGTSQHSISTTQKENTNPFAQEAHDDLNENDLLTEQTHLLNQNAAALTRFVAPHTPPNPPRILTENGLLTHTPVYKDSPEENTRRHPRREMVFGDWLPGCGPQTPRPRGRDDGDDGEFVSPAQMLIRLRGMYAGAEVRDRELWVEMAVVVARGCGSRDGEVKEGGFVEQAGSEDVGSVSRQPRPWEL